jgi:predicted alpha/beta superfamily hydrolase
MRYHEGFPSRYLKQDHSAIVYLPPGYGEDPLRRYPVLYLQDGQNLFDPSTAFGGQEWRVDETADELICADAIEPLIIVGIYNAGAERINEYTPTVDTNTGQGGRADLYARMLVDELKPFIDKEYMTQHHAQNTGLGGSSLGGLVSLAIGLKYPKVFGKLAVLSPSVWWSDRIILRDVAQFNGSLRPQIWLDMGTQEGNSPERTLEDARALRDALVGKGWELDRDLCYFEAEGADHSERAWSERVGPMLRFLFPKG